MSRNATPLIAPLRENAIEQIAKTHLKTTFALLFHTANQQLQVVTAHRVATDRRGSASIGAGHPVTPADEREIFDILTSRPCNGGAITVIPECLLYQDAHRTAWWVPGSVRPMHLRDVNGASTILTHWPNLVLCVIERTLYLAALAEDARPTDATLLYHAPLPNVFASTALCSGTAVLPQTSSIADIPAWESVVFDTAFTHANWQGGLANGKRGPSETVETYWKNRHQQVTPFPGKRLVRLDQTLAQWLAAPQGARR